MQIKDRIEALRTLMKEWGWSAAVTVGSDPHSSEYTPLRWCQREFISGFTGSAGVVVVTADHAGLWTDSRYYIQAAGQLQGTGIELHKVSTPDSVMWADWIGQNLPQNGVVGVDGTCISAGEVSYLEGQIAARHGRVESKADYLEALWPDRPLMPQGAIWLHEEQFSGRSTAQKLSWLRAKAAEKGCSNTLVSCLDQVAWLLNIRSNDVAYCPFVISYAVVEPARVILFADARKASAEVIAALAKDSIEIRPYNSVAQYISAMSSDGGIMVDPASLNYELSKAVADRFGKEKTVCCASPIDLEKALKNPVEQEGFRKAYVRDGIAQTRFFHWLEDSVASGQKLTEWQVSEKMHELRAQDPDFLDESFDTISAYGKNAALPHYETIKGQDATLEPHGLYLIDSGAHYRFGTTDITRTVPLGPLTELERQDYTLVMKAMIDLSRAIFPVGTPGCRLDAVSRRPLWQTMRNFGHGTGHGVGNVLSVHEGPQTIRQNMKDQAVEPGMITSNEPGLYREGEHGIRHENMILCVPAGENEFGSWLQFETLTMTYYDTTPLVKDLLDRDERQWLNDFNRRVAETICPHLSEDDAQWLRNKTKPI